MTSIPVAIFRISLFFTGFCSRNFSDTYRSGIENEWKNVDDPKFILKNNTRNALKLARTQKLARIFFMTFHIFSVLWFNV